MPGPPGRPVRATGRAHPRSRDRADRFKYNLEAIADLGFRAFALDLTGHGLATKGHGPDYSVAGWTLYVAEVLDALELDRVTIVGTSLGAQIAGRLAVTDPGRVQALLLVGPLGLVPIGPDARQALATAILRRSRADIRRKLEFLVGDPALITDEWVQEEWRINNSPGATESFTEISAYMAEDVDDDLIAAQLVPLLDRIPTAVVWGGADTMVPVELLRAGHRGPGRQGSVDGHAGPRPRAVLRGPGVVSRGLRGVL